MRDRDPTGSKLINHLHRLKQRICSEPQHLSQTPPQMPASGQIKAGALCCCHTVCHVGAGGQRSLVCPNGCQLVTSITMMGGVGSIDAVQGQ